MIMDNDEYRSNMDLLVSAARMLSVLPIDDLRESLERAETLAPIFEPTAYMRGGADNLRDQRELLNAVAGVVTAMKRIHERAER